MNFFREAVNVPPNVEQVAVRQKQIGEGPRPVDFEGAFAGSNFFIIFGEPNTGIGGQRPIFGRAGTNTYQIGVRSVTRTFESATEYRTNPIAQWGVAQSETMKQVLRMGVGGVRAGTVSWSNSSFAAVSESGRPVWGVLSLKDGIPNSLELRTTEAGNPYARLDYTYPTPPTGMNGYPKIIRRSSRSEEQWVIASEVTIESVRLAKDPLPEAYFADASFLTSNHVFNTYASNGGYYTVLANGKTENLGDFGKLRRGPQQPSQLSRFWIVASLCISTLLVLVFLVRSRESKKTE